MTAPNPSTECLHRVARLLGDTFPTYAQSKRVIVFGVGGVGSWCAEALLRTGIGHLTLVDADTVQPSNLNRQLMATSATVGASKVEALRERLLSIFPHADVEACHAFYGEATADRFALDSYDYVIDAIDSLAPKAQLLLHAAAAEATLFSSMGAALKLNPTGVSVAEFWKVKGCPLAAALRRRFRKHHTFPARKFQCVYSEELLTNRGSLPQEQLTEAAEQFHKAGVNGSLCHITGLFGFTLAGLVVQDLARRYAAD